jgi:radical SAM family protein
VHLGFRAFKVMDTDYCADVKRVDAISRGILERGLDIRFEILGRHWNLRTMSDEQVELLRRAGCTEIEMGVESGSQRLSDLVRKKLDVTEVPHTVRRFVRAGIRMKLNFMFGIPSETGEDLAQTLRLIDRLLVENGHDGVRLQLFRYTPLPGAAAADDVWKPKAGEPATLSLQQLADFPVVEDEPGRMYWISEQHERAVKAVYYFYAPLAFMPTSVDPARSGGRPVYYRWLLALRPLARWRLRKGFFAFPFEKWVNDRIGFPLRHGSDDGITGPDDVLAPPKMGERFDTRPPLEPEKVASSAAS